MDSWQRVAYGGWDHCFCFEDTHLKMIVTADVGPRVIFFGRAGGKNLFFENQEEIGTSGSDHWVMYGGHRFWAAPESKTRTYVADNFPVVVEIDNRLLKAQASVEPCGLQKTLSIEPAAAGDLVRVVHSLTNAGERAIEVAPWGLSVMRAGGTAVIPLTPKASHSDLLTPTLSFAHWGYTDLADQRWGWGDSFLFLRQDAHIPYPQKIGVHSGQDWAGYLNNGTLFVKFAPFKPTAQYPDFGSHFEFFTNDLFLELESLGALARLEPGQLMEHVEYWSLHSDLKTVISEEEIRQNVLPLVENDRLSIPGGS